VLGNNGFGLSVLNPINSGITSTLEKLDDFILNKPKLIVYGVGFLDIGFEDNSYCTLSSIPSYFISKNLPH
jgi:hypothetical protein